MKLSQKIWFVVLGIGIVLGGAWYLDDTQSVGGVKIPSIPKHSCLTHNTDKHMKKTQEELAQHKEEYHQNYAEDNTVKYCAYRESSGRDVFLQRYFGSKSWEEVIGKQGGVY